MKVVIIVNGGVVQSVLVDDENLKVLVLDQDNEDGDQFIDSDGNIFTASADTFKRVDKKGVDQYFNLL
jgi:hypothetical protein